MDDDMRLQGATIVDGTVAPVIVNGAVVRRSGGDVVDPVGPLPGHRLRSRVGA